MVSVMYEKHTRAEERAGSASRAVPVEPEAGRHWSARLALRFAEQDNKVRLIDSLHEGPLRVQRLFYPDATPKAHCYLLHPPGGVATGDELHIRVTLDCGEVLLTTPSAGRFYTVGSYCEVQSQHVTLQVRTGLLEWLPQETLLFNGVNAELDTQIELAAEADLAYWDVLVLGRPASGERFTAGRVSQTLSIHREGSLLLRENLTLSAGDRVQMSKIGLNAASTVGIFVLTTQLPRSEMDAWLASVNTQNQGPQFSITQRADLLVARYLGEDALLCRTGFSALWQSAAAHGERPTPAVPRIWHT